VLSLLPLLLLCIDIVWLLSNTAATASCSLSRLPSLLTIQQQDELAVLRSNKDDSIPWIPLHVVQFHVKNSAGTNAWFMQGVPLLTYVLCTDEASDVLRRVALRRPDMLTTGVSPTATSAATSDAVAADTEQGAAALPRTALLWPSGSVYVDQVSRAVCLLCNSMYLVNPTSIRSICYGCA
jgi:hypothetical protein